MTEPNLTLKPDPALDEAAVRSNHVFNAVFEDLQKRIRLGDWLPGERLPGITKFAKEVNDSTSSLRKALRSLQSIGLVKI